MKKKLPLLTTLLATALLTSCFGQVETHEHTFNLESYEHNETSHWHKATCEHTDLVKDLASHNYGSDNVCDDCGYVKPIEEQPHEHTFASEWSKDETNHWHVSTCEHTGLTKDFAEHKFGDDDVCDDCGYLKPSPVVPHEHTFESGWTKDETNHWHAATCEHTELVSGLSAHNFGGDDVCDDCGYTKPAPAHEHTFKAEYSFDETNHWYEATCEHHDLTKGLEAHNFGDDDVCDDCGYTKPAPAHEHSFATEWSKDETNHWHSATCEHTDLVSGLNAHNFGGDDVCDDCGYTKPTPAHEHTFKAEYSFDETNHWYEATCEHTELVSGLSAHNFGDDDVCDDCGYTKPTPAHEHTFKAEYSFDETNHWYEATCEHHDLTQGLEAHNFGSDDVCDDCGYTKPAPAHEHTFATEWNKDETNHWHAATCEHTELVSGLSAHNFGDDDVCDDCGYTKPAPAHEHTFETEWSKDETNHWHASTCEHTGLSKDLSAHEYGDDNICDVCGYEYIEKYYSVIWKNYNGEILEVDYQVKEGTTPTCETAPTKDDGGHVFNFTGWSPEVGPITENMVFTANFEQDMSKKLVIFKDDLGNELNRQLVLVGEEPDMTQFTYKGIIENNKVKVLTGWDKPLGKIYEDTTFVGSYETYNKTLTAGEINEVLSTASLGTNSAFDIYTYKNSSVSNIQHISIANKKYRSVFEYFDSENIDEVYMDENYRYHYRVHDGVERAMINEYEETPLFDWDIQYSMSSFTTDADYTFDLETGLFISNGSRRKVFLEMKDGQINYIKSILDNDMDAEGNATTYEELHNLKIGGVEPFDIPEHDYEGVEKYKVTFVDLSLQVINEQFVYEGSLPDFSKVNVPERIDIGDRILEFKGWENIVEPVYEDVTFAAQYYVYKKTYTKDEIQVMLTAEAYGNNVSFDYSYGTETEIIWIKYIALSNGVFKEYTDIDENYSHYERYADSNYSYYLSVEYGQVEVCRKASTSNSPESRVDDWLDTFVNDADYVYDEDLDLYVSENSYKTIWLKLKDGKVCFLKYELKQVLGLYGIVEITGVGDVPSISIPDYDWQSDSKPL